MKQIPVEVYDRCVGYFRPVAQMNKGKKEEISQRKRHILEKEVCENEQ